MACAVYCVRPVSVHVVPVIGSRGFNWKSPSLFALAIASCALPAHSYTTRALWQDVGLIVHSHTVSPAAQFFTLGTLVFW